MSVVVEAREPSARYLSATQPLVVQHFDSLATAAGGIDRLRELIQTMAVQGKLVQHCPDDETARELLARIGSRRGANGDSAPTLVQTATAAPYVLPSNWAWAKLGDLVEKMGSGWSPACEDGKRVNAEQWAVLRTTAVQIMEYRPWEHKVIPPKLAPRPEIEVQSGDILITRAGPMNRVGISCWVKNTPPRLMLSDKIVRFHAAGDEMLPAFVVLALNAGWTRAQLEVAKTGMAASQVNVSQSDLRGLYIPVCSKAEQARIVARVDELMRLCDTLEAKGRLEAEQHARLLDALLGTLTDSATPEELALSWQRVAAHFDLLLDRPEAVDTLEQTILNLAVRGLLVAQFATDESADSLVRNIQAARGLKALAKGGRGAQSGISFVETDGAPFSLPVGWAWSRFGDVASVSGGVTLGRKGTFTRPVSLPYLRVANVQRWRIDLGLIKNAVIDESERPRFQLMDGDLLITEGGDWDKVGRCAIWRSELTVCLHQNHVFKARGYTKEWNPEWAQLFLNSDIARAYFAASAKQTTNLASINMTELKHCAFPMPPLREQNRIVNRVTELRRLCADLRQRLAAGQATQSRLAEALVESATA